MFFIYFFFFKQKTAYELRISDWSSDVCSSDLGALAPRHGLAIAERFEAQIVAVAAAIQAETEEHRRAEDRRRLPRRQREPRGVPQERRDSRRFRSEEHTSELQSLMRISYAVFCLKKKK